MMVRAFVVWVIFRRSRTARIAGSLFSFRQTLFFACFGVPVLRSAFASVMKGTDVLSAQAIV